MRSKRYIWLPLVLFVYFIVMTVKFGIPMLHQGHTLKFILVCAGEIIVLVLLSLSLKRRIRYQEKKLRGHKQP